MMSQHHMAQDPSAFVPQSILPHVHLASSYKFPIIASLRPEQAADYLLSAHKIVNDAAPVAWTYFHSPPPDGTLILTWQPPSMQSRLASDGMVWADPEHVYHTEVKGYTLEILVHRSGFRYGFEQFTMHARTRYRIVGRVPGASGPQAPIDPSLWIVHYAAAEPASRYPANQVPIPPEVHVILQQRSYLEKQGQLLRKDFMLRDRGNWPEVKFIGGAAMPGVQGQARPYYNPMQQMGAIARPPQYYQQPPVPAVNGPPPPKRLRQAPSAPQSGAGVPPPGLGPDPTLDDEENTTLGDQLDYLTPREISVTRYKQHHEWMEEIFSSPYAAQQIMPIDLGLGLMGELAPLTAGILDAPTADSFTKDATDPVTTKPTDTITLKTVPKTYYKLDPEQMMEFEKRVDDYVLKEQAELERMKAAHAKKMADLKRSRTYVKAERRLRDAGKNPSRSPQDGNHLNSSSQDSDEQTDIIIQQLEESLGVKFEAKKHMVCIEKGGFIEEQPAPPAPEPAQLTNVNGTPGNAFSESSALNGLIEDGDNTAASLLDQYGSTSVTGTPGATLSVPQISQPQSQSQSAVATPSAPPTDPTQATSFPAQATMEAPAGESELVDLDVEMSGMTNAEEKAADGDWVMVDQNESGAQAATTEQPSTTPASAAVTVAASGVAENTTTGIFDVGEFGSFDNLDTAGDALADYTNAGDELGLDLDNSAFGDAFHGTETHHGDAEGENV